VKCSPISSIDEFIKAKCEVIPKHTVRSFTLLICLEVYSPVAARNTTRRVGGYTLKLISKLPPFRNPKEVKSTTGYVAFPEIFFRTKRAARRNITQLFLPTEFKLFP
jgi:hypothetical protein